METVKNIATTAFGIFAVTIAVIAVFIINICVGMIRGAVDGIRFAIGDTQEIIREVSNPVEY